MCTWVFMSLCGSLVGGWIRGWLALGPSGTWSPLPSGHFSPSLGCGGWIVPGVSLHLLLGIRPRCPSQVSQVSYLCFGFRYLLGAAAGDTFYLFLSESPETGFLFVFALQCLRSLFILNHLKNILTSHSTTNKKSLQRLNCFIFLHANIRATSRSDGAASLRL